MTIIPDTKDWTWVLRRPCDECGFDTQSFAREQIPAIVRTNAEQWHEILAGSADTVRRRPRPEKWSPLEYGCHVRDVLRLYAYRLQLMLTEDNPSFPNWDQDVTAVEDRYDEQDPATVGDELRAAAEEVAGGFEGVSGEQWTRTGDRSDGAHFTIETFGRYFVHDPVHHLHDVT